MELWMELMPGLEDDLVVRNIFPRIPWYARPVACAVCKPWKKLMQQMACEKVHLVRSRELQAAHVKGLVVSDARDTFFIHGGKKRKVPEIQGYDCYTKAVYDSICFACEGRIFMLWKCSAEVADADVVVYDEVYVMDLWAGMWEWRRTSGLRSCRAIVSLGETIYGICSSGTAELDVDTLVWCDLPPSGQCLKWLQHAFTGQGQIFGVFGFNPGELRRYNLVTSSWDLEAGLSMAGSIIVTFAGGRFVKLINQILHFWDPIGSTWVDSGVDLELGTCVASNIQGVGGDGLLIRCYYPALLFKGLVDWNHCTFNKELVFAFPPAGDYNFRSVSFIS